MKRFVALWRTELGDILGDRAVLLILLGGTLFYGFFYPLPYRFQVVNDLPVVVVDHDRSASSRRLVRMIDATPDLAVTGHALDRSQAQHMLRSGETAGIIEIPAQFERDLLRGRPTRIGVWGNAAYMLLFARVGTGASLAAATFSAGVTLGREQAGGAGSAQAMARAQPVALDAHELYNPGGGYGSYVAPAVLMLILQQTALMAIAMTGVAQRGRRRYLDPADGLVTVTAARLLAWLPLQLALLLVYLVVVYGVYGFPSQASTLRLVWLLLPFLLATGCLGLVLTALFGSRETSLQVMMLLSVPMLFLAGFAWPAQLMPPLLVKLGWLFPSTAAIDIIVRGNQMGASLAELRDPWLWCWLLVLVYGALAVLQLWLRRRRHSLTAPGKVQ